MIHIILMDKEIIMMVEHVGFNFLLKVLQPNYEKIRIKQVNADCERVYKAKRK